MEQDGLIIRHQHTTDKRVHYVCLSRKGAELFSEMAPAHERWAYEILSVLDSREQSELVRLLRTVRSRLETVL